MKTVGSRVDTKVCGSHLFLKLLFCAWHHLMNHATPFEFLNKIEIHIFLFISCFNTKKRLSLHAMHNKRAKISIYLETSKLLEIFLPEINKLLAKMQTCATALANRMRSHRI